MKEETNEQSNEGSGKAIIAPGRSQTLLQIGQFLGIQRNRRVIKSIYLIQEITLAGDCKTNKGARKDLLMAVPLENINTLFKNSNK